MGIRSALGLGGGSGVRLGSAYGEIRLDGSGVQRGVDTATRALRGLDGSFTGISKTINRAFLGATTAVVGALTAITVRGVRMAASLEEQMSNISAVMGTTTEETQALKNEILSLGLDPNLKVTSEEAAEAIEALGRNGMRTQEILDGAAYSVVLLSNATGTSFKNSADIASSAASIFGIEAKNLADAINGITAVTTNSKFTIEDYQLALAQGGGVAAAVGVEFDDFNTAIAAIAPLFHSGSDAGTSFKTMLQRLAAPTDSAKAVMNELGLEFYDAEGNLRSMAEIAGQLNQAFYDTRDVTTEVGGRTAEQNVQLARLRDTYDRTLQSIQDYELGIKGATLSEDARAKKVEDLQTQLAILQGNMEPLLAIQGEMVTTTKALTEEERARYLTAIFGADAVRAATALAQIGEEQFRSLMKVMGQTDAVEMARKRMQNLSGAVEIFQGILDTTVLLIGDKFLPTLTKITNWASTFVGDHADAIVAFFDRWGKAMDTFITEASDGEGALAGLMNALRELGVDERTRIKIYHLVTSIQSLIERVREFADKHGPALEGALKGIGAVLGSTAVIGNIIRVGKVLLGLANPITLIITLAGLLGAAINGNFGGIRDFLQGFEPALIHITEAFYSLFHGDTAGFAEGIRTGLSKAGEQITPVLEGIRDRVVNFLSSAREWFQRIDWLAVGRTIANRFITGMGTLGEKAGTFFATLFTSVTEWINNQDWEKIGRDVVTYIGGGLGFFVAYVATILRGWYEFIRNWADTADWNQIGTNIKTAVWDALSGFGRGAGRVLNGWWQTFSDWVDSVDWRGLGRNIVRSVISSLTEFRSSASSVLAGWWASLSEWFNSIDWVAIGQSLSEKFVTGMGTAGEKLGAFFATLRERATEWISGQDWEQVGRTVVTLIGGGLAFFAAYTVTILSGWYEFIRGWAGAADWLQIAQNILTAVWNALRDFGRGAGGVLSEWWQAFVNWVQGTAWPWIGERIINPIVEKLGTFWDTAVLTVAGWWFSFWEWFQNADWKLLAHNLIFNLVIGLADFWELVSETVGGWFTSLQTWFEDTDWEGLGDKVITGIIAALAGFWVLAYTVVSGWFTSLETWFDSIDWSSLGQKVVDGIVAGITAAWGAAVGAVEGLVDGITEAWNRSTESNSPSRLFKRLAGNLVDGAVIGVDDRVNKMRQAVSRLLEMSVRPSIDLAYTLAAGRKTDMTRAVPMPAAATSGSVVTIDNSQVIYAKTREAMALAMADAKIKRRRNLDKYMGVA